MTIGELNVALGAELTGLRKDLQEALGEFKKFGAKVDQQSKQQSAAFDKIGDAITGAFTVSALVAFGSKVIDITSQFQKLNVVLANTLGSNSAAQVAFGQIQEFAAKTNFSVLELTDSYVKLANQGFQPTVGELTKLGDLANSTGKGFDQLTEAIIDAQTGEFERLKEFGIRASKQGDKVTFTFKGVQTQTEFTNKAIRDYIVGLGSLDGVSGATAAISETLGGKISNLGDAFDRLFNTIGTRSDGIMKGFADSATNAINRVSDALESGEDKGKRTSANAVAIGLSAIEAQFRKIAEAKKEAGFDNLGIKISVNTKGVGLLRDFTSKLEAAQKEAAGLSYRLNTEGQSANYLQNAFDKANGKVEYYKALITAIPSLQDKVTASMNNTSQATLGIIAALEKEIKAQKEAIESATTTGAIAAGNANLKALKEQLQELQKLGTQNTLERLYDQLEKFQKLAANPDYSDKAIEGYHQQAAAITALIDGLETYQLRLLQGFNTQLEPIKRTDEKNNKLKSLTVGLQISDITPIKLSSVQKGIDKAFKALPKQLQVTLPTLAVDEKSGLNLDYGRITKGVEQAQLSVEQLRAAGVAVTEISSVIQNSLANIAVGIGESIGHLASGMGGVQDVFASLMGIVADFIKQFGTALISAGVAAIAFQNLLSNPYAAVAAGVALVALSTVVKDLLQAGPGGATGKARKGGVRAFANGAIISGPTVGLMGEYPGARNNPEVVAPLNKLRGMIGGGGGDWRIKGRDLVYIIDKQRGIDNRNG